MCRTMRYLMELCVITEIIKDLAQTDFSGVMWASGSWLCQFPLYKTATVESDIETRSSNLIIRHKKPAPVKILVIISISLFNQISYCHRLVGELSYQNIIKITVPLCKLFKIPAIKELVYIRNDTSEVLRPGSS